MNQGITHRLLGVLMKVRIRGLGKNAAHVVALLVLSNLWMARKQLMASAAAVRPKAA